MSRAPTLFAVIRRRREGPPELVPPTAPATPKRVPPPSIPRGTYRWPEHGAIEQIFREARRLRT